MKMKKLFKLPLLIIMAIIGLQNISALAVEEIKVGLAAPLTGPQAMYGQDFKNGVQLAVETFNASKPKIGGKEVRIQLIAEDDQADPRLGTQIAQKLVDKGVRAMFGNLNSSIAIPTSRIFYLAGIPQSTTASAPEYTRQKFNTTFRMLPSDTQQGAALGTFAVKKLGFKEIAIIDDRSAYGQGLADEFEKAAKAAGAKIVRREFTSDKTHDFKPILTGLKRVKPQAVFYGGTAVQAAPLVKQMRELRINSVLIAGEMVKIDAFLKVAGPAAEGTIVSLSGVPLDKMPGGAAFAKLHEQRFGTPVDVYAPYTYDGAIAIFTAMKKANSTDPKKYLPLLAKLEMPAVTTKALGYDRFGDLRDDTLTMYKVSKGSWEMLETFKSQSQN